MFFKKDHGIILAIILAIIGQSWLDFTGRFQESLLPDGFLGHVLGNVVTWPFSASRGGEFSIAKG